MKLVIKLDDETYKEVMDRTEFDTLSLGIKLIEAVQNGTPLPKGHGDLKDTQDIINRLNLNYNNHQTISVQSIKDIIQTSPTIIEADKPKRKAGTPLEENDSGYNCENWIP